MNLKRIISPSLGQKIYTHRKVIIIIATILLVVGGYALWSKYTWDEYEVEYGKWHTTTQDQLNTALMLPAVTEKERLTKLGALKKASDGITSARTSLCNANILVSWQRIAPAFRDREEKCQRTVDTSVAFSQKMQAVITYLEQEQVLTGLISAIPVGKSELAEADWQAQAAAWHETASKVKTLPSNTDFAPTKQIAAETIVKVDVAWQEVVAAHGAKDKARYTKAQTQLADSYGSLDAIAVTGAKQLKILLDPLQAAYENAF